MPDPSGPDRPPVPIVQVCAGLGSKERKRNSPKSYASGTGRIRPRVVLMLLMFVRAANDIFQVLSPGVRKSTNN